jgi:hypothetical protein
MAKAFGEEQDMSGRGFSVDPGNVGIRQKSGVDVSGIGSFVSALTDTLVDIGEARKNKELGSAIASWSAKANGIFNPAHANKIRQDGREALMAAYGADSIGLINAGLQDPNDTIEKLDNGLSVVYDANGNIKKKEVTGTPWQEESQNKTIDMITSTNVDFPMFSKAASPLLAKMPTGANVPGSTLYNIMSSVNEVASVLDGEMDKLSTMAQSMDNIKDIDKYRVKSDTRIKAVTFGAFDSLLDEALVAMARDAGNGVTPESLGSLPRGLKVDIMAHLEEADYFATFGVDAAVYSKLLDERVKLVQDTYNNALSGSIANMELAGKVSSLQVKLFEDRAFLDLVKSNPKLAANMSNANNLAAGVQMVSLLHEMSLSRGRYTGALGENVDEILTMFGMQNKNEAALPANLPDVTKSDEYGPKLLNQMRIDMAHIPEYVEQFKKDKAKLEAAGEDTSEIEIEINHIEKRWNELNMTAEEMEEAWSIWNLFKQPENPRGARPDMDKRGDRP